MGPTSDFQALLDSLGTDAGTLAALDIGSRIIPISESERGQGLLIRGPVVIESLDAMKSETIFDFHVRFEKPGIPEVVVEYQWIRYINDNRSFEEQFPLPLFITTDQDLSFKGVNGETILIRPLTMDAVSRHHYFGSTAETVEQFVTWFWFEKIARSLPQYPQQIFDLADEFNSLKEK